MPQAGRSEPRQARRFTHEARRNAETELVPCSDPWQSHSRTSSTSAHRPLSLSRVGVTGVGEGHPDPPRTAPSSSSTPRSTASSTSGPHQKGAHMSRFEEVVNEAIGEVILGEATFRAETLAEHIAERVRDRQGAPRAEVTIAARYPEHKPAPVSRHPHPGDLHAVRLGGRRPSRHAPAGRRRRPGHDRLPLRAGARRGRARASACAPTASPATRSTASLEPRPGRHPQPARPRHAARRRAPRTATRRSTPQTLLDDRRGARCRRRSTS